MTAREAALTALERCRRDGAWSGLAIDRVIQTQTLDKREAALASRLCLGVLQNSSLLDFYISCYSSQKPERLEPKLRDILRLGAYQLLFLDRIPARAAVNESVSLCRSSGCGRASGLANAVLRRLAENRDQLPEIPGKGTAAYLSIRYSHPLWLADRLIKQCGPEQTEAFFSANNAEPSLDIRVNTIKVSLEDYLRSLDRLEIPYTIPAYPKGSVSLAGGRVSELPGYEEGLFYVQDRAACAAVQIADPKPGMKVLDVCAAPGGKSFAAAMLMGGEGSILACDIHEKKLSQIQRGARVLGIDNLTVRANDARIFDPCFEKGFDLVIADVPCSGFGVIRKKPEIREKSAEEISGLPLIQFSILETVSRYVKPGGTLLYSTCTVLAEENEGVVDPFLDRHPDFAPVDFDLGGGCRSERGMHTFWPQLDGTDGFFAAKLRRKP